jgi:hypothetical protein
MDSRSPGCEKVPIVNEVLNLKHLHSYLETAPGRMHCIDHLADQFNAKRRGIHDFVGVCSCLGVCQKVTGNSFEWVGSGMAAKVVSQVYESMKKEPGDVTDFLRTPIDQSLSSVTLALIKLFFHLGIQYLDLRKAARLFAQDRIKYKTMLRKLYTVVSGLEIAGVLRRTQTVSEIQLNLDPRRQTKHVSYSISSVLNTEHEVSEEQRFYRNRRQFERMSGSARSTQFKHPGISTADFPSLGPALE